MYLVRKTETFTKLFFLVSCTGLFLYAILAFYTFHVAYTSMSQVQKLQDLSNDLHSVELKSPDDEEYDKDLKYILFWTQSDHDSANPVLSEGPRIFTDHRCDYANCFLTYNKTMLKRDHTNFDAIVFNISVIKNWKKLNMPQRRSQRQKYVFYSLQSSDEAPVCNFNADNYFNWTWTYKLNSDIVSHFIEVTDLQGNVVAPKLQVDWPKNQFYLMDEKNSNQPAPKRKTIAWIMNKCNGKNKQSAFIRELQAKFKINFLDFDVYGCGHLTCPQEGCLQEIKKYYFYLVYESNAEDYVDKEVVKAYNHGAVPVILGGADYRRFLPDGSYFNAQSMSVDNITAKIAYIVKNPYLYHSYFNWKKSYSIHETEDFKGLCDLCAYLNDEEKFGTVSVYKKFRKWWYPRPLYEKCILKGAQNWAYINSSVNLK